MNHRNFPLEGHLHNLDKERKQALKQGTDFGYLKYFQLTEELGITPEDTIAYEKGEAIYNLHRPKRDLETEVTRRDKREINFVSEGRFLEPNQISKHIEDKKSQMKRYFPGVLKNFKEHDDLQIGKAYSGLFKNYEKKHYSKN